MGAGIAQVAITRGWHVLLMDVDESALNRAVDSIGQRLRRQVEKERMSDVEAETVMERLHPATDAARLGACELLIEAIVEDLDTKTAALRALLPSTRDDAVIATNTSSLSVTTLGEAVGCPQRLVGMHFFNPAPLMRLVEVVPGESTRPEVVDRAVAIAEAWGKRVARSADVPGFIVNHVARPYYLEAFRILEDRLADVATIDAAMRDLGGFRMGPLELTDLIGQDVNAATTRSIWKQLDHPPMLHPSTLQESLVANGHLGRKSGRGVYDHGDEKATPAIRIHAGSMDDRPALREAVDRFVDRATDGVGDATRRYVFARILVALIAQAERARASGVAGRDDIDTAMKHGTNHPAGPFEWLHRIGHEPCIALLEALDATVEDDRFAVPATLATGRG